MQTEFTFQEILQKVLRRELTWPYTIIQFHIIKQRALLTVITSLQKPVKMFHILSSLNWFFFNYIFKNIHNDITGRITYKNVIDFSIAAQRKWLKETYIGLRIGHSITRQKFRFTGTNKGNQKRWIERLI